MHSSSYQRFPTPSVLLPNFSITLLQRCGGGREGGAAARAPRPRRWEAVCSSWRWCWIDQWQTSRLNWQLTLLRLVVVLPGLGLLHVEVL